MMFMGLVPVVYNRSAARWQTVNDAILELSEIIN